MQDLPYCQVMGQQRLDLNWRRTNEFNAMAPYPNMNSACITLPETYTRMPSLQC